ncbi:MAG: type II secretion system protein [Pseudomonadota bacterium]
MIREEGFTLAEVLISLIVISAGAVATQGVVMGITGHWARADMLKVRADVLLANLEAIHGFETSLRTSSSDLLYLDVGANGNEPLVLASPQIDHPSDCRFDLVGRRCR